MSDTPAPAYQVLADQVVKSVLESLPAARK